MARTALPTTTLMPDGSVAQPAGNAVDPTNGHVIAANTLRRTELIIDIDSTFAGAKDFTIKKGNLPGSGAGDLVVTINAARRIIGPLNTARFIQDDGTILVDVAAAATGTIRAYRVPRA